MSSSDLKLEGMIGFVRAALLALATQATIGWNNERRARKAIVQLFDSHFIDDQGQVIARLLESACANDRTFLIFARLFLVYAIK